MKCPCCGSRTSICIRCEDPSLIGTRMTCERDGAAVVCKGCGLVVTDKGVLTLDNKFLPWPEEGQV